LELPVSLRLLIDALEFGSPPGIIAEEGIFAGHGRGVT
jgi:hypothetical protein